ncbi:MAG: hypothetical protein Q4D51_03410 [Eubacteriales bacterium]|nr:hypothetical protein [Eubacteriales bacterium]
METIAEKSRTKEIIDRLQGIVNSASPVPLAAGKISVYKDEVQSLLDELAMQMDAELKTYHEVNDRRGKIINEAKKEAEKIIYQAEHTASRMRVTKRSTNVAALDYTMLSEEEISSLTEANEIYAASLIYTDEMLTEVSKMIEDAYHNIRSDYEVVMQVFEDKLQTLVNNKNELMSGLQELDEKDRSQQILEIGQLLSDELYNERMKQRMNSDEYEDGSVQLTLDLQVEQAEETARQAQAQAREAAQALEQMTAERDALMATVKKMEQDKQSETAIEDDEEYEIVYVTEDELEEGEEYEIEYVDEDDEELESEIDTKQQSVESQVVAKEQQPESEESKKIQNEKQDLKVEENLKVDSEKENSKEEQKETPKEEASAIGIVEVETKKEDDQANAETVKLETQEVKSAVSRKKNRNKKKKGFIERAVENREQDSVDVIIEGAEAIVKEKQGYEMKTDAAGNQYVQATMKFDEDLELSDF